MKIDIPRQAQYILQTLMNHGYEAYIVGGCVRDSILNRNPQDWDITTNASPVQVKQLFRRTIDTGIEHGTVTVLMEKEQYEVTTYRVDGKYSDHRRPNEVTFTQTLEEDLLRRDFTINAMAYNDVDGLIDLYDGLADLKAGRIRCVGVPRERFDEDALRILRAFRFAAQLGFEIETETMKAAAEQAKYLDFISAERIAVELTKLLVSDHPEELIHAKEAGVTAIVLPEFDRMLETTQNNPHHCYDVGRHAIESVRQIAPESVLRFTMLLHDVGKPRCKTTDEQGIDHFKGHSEMGVMMAKEILRRLKLDNHTIRTVSTLIHWHDLRWGSTVSAKQVRRAASKVGKELFPQLLQVQRADVLAQSQLYQREKLEMLDKIAELYQDILESEQCLAIKDLAIDGNQLMQLGIPQGKQIGEILKMLLEMVVEEPSLNQYSSLVEILIENGVMKRPPRS
ncbi:MAG: CCA tRNA nucleotidyltransferase [Lachnospiraceae bacterium]